MRYRTTLVLMLLALCPVLLLGREMGAAARGTRGQSAPVSAVSTLSLGSTTSTSLVVFPSTTVPDLQCGDSTGDGAVTATDALVALRAGIGLQSCELCVCDVDGSGAIAATDALMLLALAVGQEIQLACPPC